VSIWYDAHLVLVQATFTNILLALSIQLPLRMGVFSFAGAGSYGIGAYATAVLVTRYSSASQLAIVLSVLIAGALGYLLSIVFHRLDGLAVGMGTLAFSLIIGVAALNGGSLTGGSQGLFGVISSLPIAEVVGAVALVLLISALTERGRSGRRVEVLRNDAALAVSMGVRVGRMRRVAFIISGGLGALAGGINVIQRTTVTPAGIGLPIIILALTMAVIGGIKSWRGAVIGAIIFTWLPNILSFVSNWQTLIYGIVVAGAAVWTPSGVVGAMSRGLRWYRISRRRPPGLPALAGNDQMGVVGVSDPPASSEIGTRQ
jgi:branched-chain amino acid transport system permease protein